MYITLIAAIIISIAVHKFCKESAEKFIIGITLFSWYASFRWFRPDQAEELFKELGFTAKAYFDFPSLFALILFLWIVWILVLYFWWELKKNADIAIGEGCDHPESCISSRLNIVGDTAFLRVNGIKAIPIDGSSAWYNPLTHIHRIGSRILLFTAKMVQDTDIMYAPFEVKPHIRQRRFDLFGIKKVSAGYLTNKELEAHKDFSKADLEKYITEIDSSENTMKFTSELAAKNQKYDYVLQSLDHENKSITQHLETQAGIGKAVGAGSRDKTILEKIGVQ